MISNLYKEFVDLLTNCDSQYIKYNLVSQLPAVSEINTCYQVIATADLACELLEDSRHIVNDSYVVVTRVSDFVDPHNTVTEVFFTDVYEQARDRYLVMAGINNDYIATTHNSIHRGCTVSDKLITVVETQ